MDAATSPEVPTGKQHPAPRVEVVRGTPTDEELAALLAVVGEEYTRETEEAVADEPQPSAWQRTQRRLRGSLRRDIPWGRFSG